MRKILLLAALFFGTLSFAQGDFKKGYYIDNEGVKTEGYLKSSNFKSINDASFTSLEFKKDLDQEVQKIDKFYVTAFGIGTELKYQKMVAMIDDVSFFRDYGFEKNFNLQEKTVFLNVLVEGNATLYAYDGGQGIKYLWKMAGDEAAAKQLLYKKYNKSNATLTENNAFREQLFNHVKCPNQTFSDFLKVKYDRAILVALFTNYNKCSNSTSVVYKEEEKGEFSLKVSVLAGYNFARFQLANSNPPRSADNFTMPTIGAEIEFFTPSKKLSFFLSTEYKKAKAESSLTLNLSEFNPNVSTFTYRLDTDILDFVLGGRYNFNFNTLGTVFVGGGVGLNVPFANNIKDYQTNSTSDLSLISRTEILKSYPFVRMHVGYIFAKHYGFDLHFDTTKYLAGNATDKLKLNEMGINLRYTF